MSAPGSRECPSREPWERCRGAWQCALIGINRYWLISGISAFHSEELNVRSDLKGVAWASEKQPLKHANSVPLFRRILG